MGSLKEHVIEYEEEPTKFKFQLKINYKGEIFTFKKITTMNGISEVMRNIETKLRHKIARKDIVKKYDMDNV